MDEFEFLVTPGYGQRQLRRFHSSQAVRIGNRLERPGQGGRNDDWEAPDVMEDEITQAFRQVERTSAAAGAGWENVGHGNPRHVGFDGHQEEINPTMAEAFRHYMPNHAPVWKCLGAVAFGDPRMRVEIRLTAVLSERRQETGAGSSPVERSS